MDLSHHPTKPGCYIMRNERGDILYIGKAKHLRNRIKQYFVHGRDGREMVPFLTAQIDHIETIVCPSEKEALILENALIKRHQPKYNVLLKDDKTFISLMLNTRHQWPMLKLVRYLGKPSEKGVYFGPYISAFAARQTLDVLMEIFPLRQCSDHELKSRKRPCLLWGIKRCIAPCVGKCTKEEYKENVTHIIRFLKGEDKTLIKDLERKMHAASEQMEYERAASLLSKIKRLKMVSTTGKSVVHTTAEDHDALGLYRVGHHVVVVLLIFRDGAMIGSEHFQFKQTAADDADVIASFLLQHYKKEIPKLILLPEKMPPHVAEIISDQHGKKIKLVAPQVGEKKRTIEMAFENAKTYYEQYHSGESEDILLELEERLNLNRCPIRIECFDTSNISGTNPVASMVAFTDGKKDKNLYRLYKIQSQGDDYNAMREVLTRRYQRGKEEDDLPDLIIVDGGKGQLNLALEVLAELDIASCDVIALTKEEARHDKGLTAERIFLPHKKEPIALKVRSPLLFFLQNIRDEAHRRAISLHRQHRAKRTIQSALDAVPGIGPAKKKKLLQHFGSFKQVKEASREELEKIPGLSSKDIDNILNA